MACYDQAMSFLSNMFYEEKGKYGTTAVAFSALSAILPKTNGQTLGRDDRVSRMIKGTFKLHRSLPKYVVIYDPDIILQYMDSLPANNLISMDLLTKNLCTLLCLLSGQRSQTISSLKKDRSVLAHGACTFYIDTIQKTTRPGRHQPPLVFQSFEPNEKLCIINCLKEYSSRTDILRKNLERTTQQLILSYAYPHNWVNSQTIAPYEKLFLGMLGIDITIFTAHSIRSASTSTANNMGLSIKDIQKAAGWSGDSTFRKN